MRYLFCAFTTPGLLFPLVGLALELRSRGHEVAFATGTGAEPFLRAAGVERIPRGDAEGDSFLIPRWTVPLAVAVDVKHVEYALRAFTPDVLVGNQFALSACIVRERTGIPLCMVGMAAYLWPRREGCAPEFPACEGHSRWRHRGMQLSLNGARALFGLQPLERTGDEYPLLGDLFLLRSVPELERSPDTLPRKVRLVGACEWEPPADRDAAWRELSREAGSDGAPVLYVQQGRTFSEPSFWPHLVDALGGAPFRVFASVGRMDSPVGALPSHFVARDHLPQGVVLPHADLVVSGAHSAVTLGTLAHGLPSVAIPATGGEMADNAERLERAGCTVRLDPYNLTPKQLRQAVDRALEDEQIRQNASRLRDAFARVQGFRFAADSVEQLN